METKEAGAGVDAPSSRSIDRSQTGTSRTSLGRALRGSVARGALGLPLTLLVTPLILGHLSVGQYGVWATVSSLLAVGGLADAGIRTEITRRVAEARGRDDDEALRRAVREGVTLLVATATFVLVVVAAVSGVLVHTVFPRLPAGVSYSELRWLLVAVAALLSASLVLGGYFALLPGLQRSDVEDYAQVCGLLIGTMVSVGCLVAGVGIGSLLLGTATQTVVCALWEQRWLRRVMPESRLRLARMSRPVARGFLVLSGLALLTQVCDVVDFQVDKVVLSRYVSADAVGQFQLGTSLTLQLRAAALLPLAVLLAGTAELHGARRERLERLYELASRASVSCAALVLGGIVLLGPAVVHLWLGNGYADAGTAARLMGVAMYLNVVAAPWTYYALGRGWNRLPAASATANMVVNGVASFLLTTHIGFRGAVYGSMLGSVTGVACFWVLLHRAERRPWLRPARRSWALLAVATGVLVLAFPTGPRSAAGVVGAVLAYIVVGGAVVLASGDLDVRAMRGVRR
jgi:O-antigen/teichoic acid export membrane protein